MNVLPQCVRKGFLGICENDHKLLGHSSLVTPNFWPLPSQKNPVKHREGKASALLHSSALKKSCHLPNKNVVSGLHQRPPLDPRKREKAWVEFVCLRIPLTIVFDASLNYVSGSPLVQMGPLLGYLFITPHALQLKKNPEERKTVENLGKEMGACAILEFKRRLADADDERQRKREQDQTFNTQPTVKLVQIIPWL